MDNSSTHIHIVDDDQSFGKSLKRLLNARGFSADYYPSAGAFLDSAPIGRQGNIAVVDVNMPECDGFSLMDRMHAIGCSMPVIVITGQVKADTRSIAIRRGAMGFLRKPFDERSLLDLIPIQNRG